jgi:hypothetical protein
MKAGPGDTLRARRILYSGSPPSRTPIVAEVELAAPQPEADARVSRATLASQVEDAIRIDIIAGALEPGY